jgi:hypothetical protein
MKIHLFWHANADDPHGFGFVKRLGGGGCGSLLRLQTQSNATIAAGDAVIITNGLVRIALAASTALAGVAAESVTGVTGTRQYIHIYPALPDYVFEGNLDGDGTESQLGTGLAVLGTTGIMEVDSTGGTTSVVQIIGLKDGDTWDSHANVLFIIAKSQITGQP